MKSSWHSLPHSPLVRKLDLEFLNCLMIRTLALDTYTNSSSTFQNKEVFYSTILLIPSGTIKSIGGISVQTSSGKCPFSIIRNLPDSPMCCIKYSNWFFRTSMFLSLLQHCSNICQQLYFSFSTRLQRFLMFLPIRADKYSQNQKQHKHPDKI